MKNTNALARSTAFWLLLIISLGLTGIGGWLVTNQVTSMTSSLLDGTATNVDVYVGQSLVVFGAAVLGAGLLGILLSLVLGAVKALLPTSRGALSADAIAPQAEEAKSTEGIASENTASDNITAENTVAPESTASDNTAPEGEPPAADADAESDADAEAATENEPSITR